jgi:general secretion pathway protein E/type IV pilus assembly protein PilB
LVFSTLHTNDASSAYTRLVDMGVEPYLVASTVEAVMAQRLVRRLCEKCKRPVQVNELDLPLDFPVDELDGHTLFEKVGCRECRHVGYRGRLGIYELLLTTEEIQKLANEQQSSWEIKKAAVRSGMVTLRQDGWKKAIAGVTSVDEILRVTKGDRELAFEK